MSSFFAEFVAFLQQYNVIGICIGLLIATKVADLGKSLIEDLLMPLLFSPLMRKMRVEKLEDLSYGGVLYGRFLARFVDFIVIALFVFIVVKASGISLSS
ncbi:MAG TPA: MscL family protein [Candidatus Absconditabacterales bacterium]|nr:MscL family protein [Candidatus Absconditabacterales bacterium]HMT27112.1 MscL family protein [Candidatus Absconditabacterales bacterium]